MMAFTAVAAGCSFNKEWSYKTSEKELPIGVYIYCLNNAYATAQMDKRQGSGNLPHLPCN